MQAEKIARSPTGVVSELQTVINNIFSMYMAKVYMPSPLHHQALLPAVGHRAAAKSPYYLSCFSFNHPMTP